MFVVSCQYNVIHTSIIWHGTHYTMYHNISYDVVYSITLYMLAKAISQVENETSLAHSYNTVHKHIRPYNTYSIPCVCVCVCR